MTNSPSLPITKFNILWIDDQHVDQADFHGEAHFSGITLIPFTTSREGMKYLGSHHDDIDAVILDAKVYAESDDETPELTGLMDSLRGISAVCAANNKVIPHVILTGKPGLLDDATFKSLVSNVRIFNKNDDNDILFNELITLIGDSRNAYFRNKYADIYQFCRQDELTEPLWKSLLPLLKHVSDDQQLSIDPYNQIRQCLELVFRALHKTKILHELLVTREVNLRLSSLYLAGKTAGPKANLPALCSRQPIFPHLIAKNVEYILDVTQVGSHSEDPSQTSAEARSIEFLEKYVPQHHLVSILVPMLLDLITWANSYMKEHPDEMANRALWKQSNEGSITCTGQIISSDHHGNFYVKPDADSEVIENIRIFSGHSDGLAIGTKVEVTSEDNPGKNFRVATSHQTL